MLALADLVVDAEVKSIICNGPPVVTAKKTITKYISTLWPSKGYKGSVPKSFTIKGERYVYVGVPPTGGWHQQPVPEGWVGKLYLKRGKDGSYAKVWWNGLIEDTALSKPKALPTCASSDAGVPDAGVVDASVRDTGLVDAMKVDSAPLDQDATVADSAPLKDGATVVDSATRADGGVRADTSAEDSGGAGSVDDGGCTMGQRALTSELPWGLLACLAFALVVRRRRRP